MSPRRDETKPFLRKGLTLQLSPYVSETPNGIVYAMTLSTILKLYLLRYTPLTNSFNSRCLARITGREIREEARDPTLVASPGGRLTKTRNCALSASQRDPLRRAPSQYCL